jgi:hypothetical protein
MKMAWLYLQIWASPIWTQILYSNIYCNHRMALTCKIKPFKVKYTVKPLSRLPWAKINLGRLVD